ncbi:MAG: FAD:protein FMN transferase [Ruminococcus sp.]|nr:FAD:protein FMN transferase [Ruminococcus sp.]
MKKFFCILLTLTLSIVPLAGCKAKAPLKEEELYALDTIITMSVYSDNTEAIDFAENEIKRLESLLSVTNSDSDVNKINDSAGSFVRVSDECFELIKTAKEVSKATSGFFDVTVYPAVKLWGFTSSIYKVPTDSELLEVKSLIDYNKIEIDESTKSIRIPEGASLDLGGIAKGFIADKAAEALQNQGVESALLNFGGNIRLIGSKPQGESFKIGIKAPFKEGYFAILKAKDITASTAGGYERYFEENGKRYHHILNPFTASPAESNVLSATVIGKSGEVCDALSTAAFVMGTEGIGDLTSKYEDYSFIILTEECVYVSKAIFDAFELTEGFKTLKISLI